MRRSVATVIIMLAVAMAGGVLFTPVTMVRVMTIDGSPLACERVAPGTRVILTFTHSMYGGDVTETWLADGTSLSRQSILTDNAAAAEYYAWDGRVERRGDRFEVMAGSLDVERLAIHVDRIGQHRLTVGGTALDLAAMVEGTAQVWIEPVTGTLVTQPRC